MKPKIKPKLMWGLIHREGDILYVRETRDAAKAHYNPRFGETIQQVLVCGPPKRRKRHAK